MHPFPQASEGSVGLSECARVLTASRHFRWLHIWEKLAASEHSEPGGSNNMEGGVTFVTLCLLQVCTKCVVAPVSANQWWACGTSVCSARDSTSVRCPLPACAHSMPTCSRLW